mmetsp:Transcript_8146/g.30169  ORF Transcript_8146/g.30169 Transcript_8146/m.30169 type:complete len:317 (-) Transcript_8146:1609-2559(-)
MLLTEITGLSCGPSLEESSTSEDLTDSKSSNGAHAHHQFSPRNKWIRSRRLSHPSQNIISSRSNKRQRSKCLNSCETSFRNGEITSTGSSSSRSSTTRRRKREMNCLGWMRMQCGLKLLFTFFKQYCDTRYHSSRPLIVLHKSLKFWMEEFINTLTLFSAYESIIFLWSVHFKIGFSPSIPFASVPSPQKSIAVDYAKPTIVESVPLESPLLLQMESRCDDLGECFHLVRKTFGSRALDEVFWSDSFLQMNSSRKLHLPLQNMWCCCDASFCSCPGQLDPIWHLLSHDATWSVIGIERTSFLVEQWWYLHLQSRLC